ncbi:MAG: LysR substrate-binding domain-containing protein [Acidobacteriota bacterium]
MDLEVRHLRLMVAVTEEKSVTKAGEKLHLTQSALSHQLRDIEDRLGTTLFLRMNKRMIPTQAGERLLETARQVLAQMEHAETEISQMASSKSGSLRLSTECYTCYHWLPGVLKEFARDYPGVDVNIVVEATRHPIEALLNGKLDLAIVSSTDHDKRLRYRSLFGDEMVAVMAADHGLTQRAYLRPRDFADEHLILYVPKEDSTVFKKVLNPAGVTPGRLSEVQLTEAILEMVKAGIGISVLAKWAVKDQLESRRIVARPVTKNGLHRQWRAAMLKQDKAPTYLDAFVDLLSRPAMPIDMPGICRLVNGR